MPPILRMAGLMIALSCVACAEPVPAPLPQQAVVSIPTDPSAQSCDASLPRAMSGQSASSDAPSCLPKTKGGLVLDRHLFDSRYDFGHGAVAQELGPAFAERNPAPSRRSPTPSAGVQHCGDHLLNKVVIPFCIPVSR